MGSFIRIAVLALVLASSVHAARVKDVAKIRGLTDVQLVGYGLVIGLKGTGDGSRTQFTVQSVVNMLKKMGVEVDAKRLRVKNVAAVMVTANLKPFVKEGSRVDVNVSSIGDARSLEGGQLLMTPLQAPNGEVYAVAQGALSVGGLQFTGKHGSSIHKNHVLSGNIPLGGLVHKEIKTKSLEKEGAVEWVLGEPDFTSAVAMADAINGVFPNSAEAVDASLVKVTVPQNQQGNLMRFISAAENAEFTVAMNARVVLNEKTGTLVAGSDVRISEVAVSHGSITINVETSEEISQPDPMSMGTTGSVIQEQVQMQQGGPTPPEVKVLPAVSNAGELAQALNALGVSPQDIIAIFQAIKKAGALHAELVIM